MKAHPAADLFPMLPEPKLRELADDIKTNGQKLPIVVTRDDLLLDGRNRFEACKRAGVPPRIETWTGQKDPIDFVVSMNLTRRHLDESQRGLLSAQLAKLRAGTSPPRGGVKRAISKAADETGASSRSTERGMKLLREATPGEIDAIKNGEVSMGEVEKTVARRKRGLPPPSPDDEDSDERYTTRAQFELCLRLAGVEKVLLDVAACAEAHVCPKYFTKADSGLEHDWDRFWWCNPPWSDIRPWVEHAFRARAPGLMLLPAWTDRAWWQELIEPARDQAHSSIFTRFLPRAPFGSPGNPTAKGVEQPHFWTVLISFHGPMPSRERVVDGQAMSRKTKSKPKRRNA